MNRAEAPADLNRRTLLRQGVVASLAIAACALLVMAPDAFAEGGGTTVETAPLLTPGVTVSGNTAADSVISNVPSVSGCMQDVELWTLSLTAGDQVLLKGQVEAPADGFEVAALPPGVTDAELAGSSEIAGIQRGSLENGLSFAASKSGTWLVVVGRGSYCGGHDGPYQLAATVYPPAFIAGPGGGNTVETAPSLTPGQTVSGNTAADSVISNVPSVSGCMQDVELWTLSLTAGDQVLLKGQVEAPADGFEVAALPPGVNDATLFGVAEVAGIQRGSLENGLSFAASKSGTWLVVVGRGSYCGGHDGPYQLAATVYPPAFIAGPGGGNTVETAPSLTPGQMVSGNTASDSIIANIPSVSGCMHDVELWRLNIVAGDKVLLKGRVEAPADGFEVAALPPGVNDATLFGVAEIAGIQRGSLENGLSFAASKSGTWLVVVGRGSYCGGHDGPYQLTASGPPPTTPPAHPSITVTTSRLVVSKGTVPIRISCKNARCSGSVELTEQILVKHRKGRKTVTRKKTLVLASASFSLAAGQSETVHLKLTSSGKRLLAHARKHHVAAKLTVAVNGGAATTKAIVVS